MQEGLPILHERLLSLDAHPTEVFPINEGVISTITNYLSKEKKLSKDEKKILDELVGKP